MQLLNNGGAEMVLNPPSTEFDRDQGVFLQGILLKR